ncbi:UNVERIFIED_CONTAM: hypothetical protein FKN15_065505 [Acipenser sinensis]
MALRMECRMRSIAWTSPVRVQAIQQPTVVSDAVALGWLHGESAVWKKKRSADGTRFGGERVFVFAVSMRSSIADDLLPAILGYFKNPTANGNVEAKVVCFYRRRDISSTLIALADKHATKMNTRCPLKRVPSAARFFTSFKLAVQPPQSFSVRGQRSSGQLTGKPADAWPNYRGRWCAVSRGHFGRPNPPSSRVTLGQLSAAPWELPSTVGCGIAWTRTRDIQAIERILHSSECFYWMRHSGPQTFHASWYQRSCFKTVFSKLYIYKWECNYVAATYSYQWYSWGPPNMQCRLCASCWTYWKKYGGLRMPTRLDGERPGPNRNNMSPHGLPMRHSGSPKFAVKTRQAFYLQTTNLTKVARRLCRDILRPQFLGRHPYTAVNSAAIKAEFTTRLSEIPENPLTVKQTVRKPLESVVRYLETHPSPKPDPPRSATISMGSLTPIKSSPILNNGSPTILGKRSYEQHNGMDGEYFLQAAGRSQCRVSG